MLLTVTVFAAWVNVEMSVKVVLKVDVLKTTAGVTVAPSSSVITETTVAVAPAAWTVV